MANSEVQHSTFFKIWKIISYLYREKSLLKCHETWHTPSVAIVDEVLQVLYRSVKYLIFYDYLCFEPFPSGSLSLEVKKSASPVPLPPTTISGMHPSPTLQESKSECVNPLSPRPANCGWNHICSSRLCISGTIRHCRVLYIPMERGEPALSTELCHLSVRRCAME